MSGDYDGATQGKPEDEERAPVGLSDLAELRCATYRLFSSLLLHPEEGGLDAAVGLARWLRRQPALGELAFSAWACPLLDRLSGLAAEGMEALGVEYVGLFLLGYPGPPCPLYESVYADPSGRRRGLVAVAVERAYAQAGMALAPEAGRELPDHAGIELEFLSQLCRREAQAWRAGAAEDALAALEIERRFLDGHLLRWFPSLLRRVDDAAEPGSLYRQAVGAAHGFLVHDRDLIDLVGSIYRPSAVEGR